jgi:hypothetical protein
MTSPDDTPTAEQPTVAPTVSTAPARSRWHWSALPDHLGRARTSTVVLGVLFLALGMLYLYVRPPTPEEAATTSGTGSVVTDAPQTTTAPTTAPLTTTAPETSTDQVPTTTGSTGTGSTGTTSTTEPTSTLPTDTTGTSEPTTTLPTLTPQMTPNTTASSPTP